MSKLLLLLSLLTGISGCTLNRVMLTRSDLHQIQPGMTQTQVTEVLGKPTYRRFNPYQEEWEYRKSISMEQTVVVICFEEGKVVSMDSFGLESGQQQSLPQPQLELQPQVSPVYPVLRPAMTEAEFQHFYQLLRNEPFTKERTSMLRTLAASKRITCRQCAQFLKLYSFSEEKKNILGLFAAQLCDRENYRLIQDCFDFATDRKEVLQILGIQ